MIRITAALGLMILTGCPSAPTSPTAFDASDAAAATEAAALACANAKRLGCALGDEPECVPALRTAVTAGVTSPNVVVCGATAASPSALGACGAFFVDACTPPGGHP